MIFRYACITLFTSLVLISCSKEETEEQGKEATDTRCQELSTEKQIELTGSLIISSTGELVLKSVSDDSMNIACPTYLVACNDEVKSYIYSQYDAFSRIKLMNENFWITITGAYLNLDHYYNQTDDFHQLEFLFDHVSLVNNPQQ